MICYHFVGPQVSLGSEVLDFGRIHSGDKATKTLDIVNDSDVPAAFQVSKTAITSVEPSVM